MRSKKHLYHLGVLPPCAERRKALPQRMLRWHYRSRHESLVTVSNHEFYEDRLVIFPSPERNGRNAGLVYHYLLDTVYDRGGSRSNPGEARMVAQAVMETLSPVSKPEEIAETVARATLAIADARSVARF